MATALLDELSPIKQFCVYLFVISIIRLSLAGVYRKAIASRLPTPIFMRIIRPKNVPDDKLRKLHENLFYSIWHTFSFFAVLLEVRGESWFQNLIRSLDTNWTIYNWPHGLHGTELTLYLFELAFWVSCLLFMAVETVRKDFKEMIIHHIATIGLICLSYHFGFHRIGFIVLLVHDCGDIFLYSAKFFNYLKIDTITNILFGLFVIVFFAARLVAFPFVITTAWYSTLGHIGGIDGSTITGAPILPSLLSVLQVLHYMWFGLILRMVYRMIVSKGSSPEKDIRSDDEDEDSHKTETTKKNDTTPKKTK